MKQLLNKEKYGKIFYYFSEISKIPRESGNEQEISDYLVDFAKKRGLNAHQDEYLNVVIKKPATKGYESSPGVIIQGHMDMVCEKNNDVQHDFNVDPIQLMVDGDQLTAEGTTLGADNGIAVAYALTLLDSDDIEHPELEVVMTTDEEVGLTGAIKIDASDLKGQYFINLDSEEEGELTVSCAGGLKVQLKQTVRFTYVEGEKYLLKEVMLKGLKGGHSGMEIDKNRANANKLTGRLLCKLDEALSIYLVDIQGGMKDNVIPRENKMTLIIKKQDEATFNKIINQTLADIKAEYQTSDPDLTIVLDSQPLTKKTQVIDVSTLKKLIFMLMNLPNGIQTMSRDIDGLVESSLNLGVVSFRDNIIVYESAIRSSVRSKKYFMGKQLELFADLLNMEFVQTADYPEWPLKKDSEFLELCIKAFENLYNKKPIVKGIHAGLEGGVFLEKLPHLQAISMGPDLFDVHSPDEYISISSIERTWDYLLEILKSIHMNKDENKKPLRWN